MRQVDAAEGPIAWSRRGPVLNYLPLWDLVDVLIKSRRVEFGGNDDGNLRGEEALWALDINVEEVVEAENSAADKDGHYIATWPIMDLYMDAEK